MPVTWLLSLVGLLGLAGLWVGEGLEGMADAVAFPFFAALFAAPTVIWLMRLVRGHFHPAVRDL